MTDILKQEGNTNNEIPAYSASLEIQAIGNSLVPKYYKVWMKDFPTNILSQKGFVSAAGYDDESDK